MNSWKLILFSTPDTGDCTICFGLWNNQEKKIICLDCGGEFEADDVKIIHQYDDFSFVNDTLMDAFNPFANEERDGLVDFLNENPSAAEMYGRYL